MMEWTYGTLKGNGGHFLEQGNLLMAKTLLEFYDTIHQR
jgi:hypothetical protein